MALLDREGCADASGTVVFVLFQISFALVLPRSGMSQQQHRESLLAHDSIALHQRPTPPPADSFSTTNAADLAASSSSLNPAVQVQVKLTTSWPDAHGAPDSFCPFVPLVRSAFLSRLARHHRYYLLMVASIALQIAISVQPWLTGYALAAVYLLIDLCCNLPVFLAESTRMDRALLWRLLRSFEWWWMTGNHLMYLAMRLALIATGRTDSDALMDTPDIVAQVTSNLFWLAASLYCFSMDSLVGVRARYKLVWLVGFSLFLCFAMVERRIQRSSDEALGDIRVCFIDCTTARNLQSAALINIALYMLRFIIRIARNPRCMMMLGPVCVLQLQQQQQQQDGADRIRPWGSEGDS